MKYIIYVLCFILGIYIRTLIEKIKDKKKKQKQEEKILKKGNNGCYHTSNKKLEVTALGDKEQYYLCEKCGEKIKSSEINYFEE